MPEIEPVSTPRPLYASSNAIPVSVVGESSRRIADTFGIEPESPVSRAPGYASYRPRYDDSDLEAGRPAPWAPELDTVAPRRPSRGWWSTSKKAAAIGLAAGAVLIGTGVGVYYGYSVPTVRKCAETWCNQAGNAAPLTVQQCINTYKNPMGDGPSSDYGWCASQMAAGFGPIVPWVVGGFISIVSLLALTDACANVAP